MTKSYHTVNGRIIGETTNGVFTGYLPDAQGNVTATVDENGAIINTYRYKPNGEVHAKTGAGEDPKFLWNGTHGYRQTGVPIADTYIRARHFARQAGQWISTDPRWPEALPYNYVGGNPVNHIDPSGCFQGRPDRPCNDARGSCAGTTESSCEYSKGVPNFPPDGWNPPCGDKISEYVDMYCRGKGYAFTDNPFQGGGSTNDVPGITPDVIRCMVWAESSGRAGIRNEAGRGTIGPRGERFDIIPSGLMQWKGFADSGDKTQNQCSALADYHGCKWGGIIPLGNGKWRSLDHFDPTDACDNLRVGIYLLCNCKYAGNVNRKWPKELGEGEFAWGTNAKKNSPFCCCMCGFGKKAQP